MVSLGFGDSAALASNELDPVKHSAVYGGLPAATYCHVQRRVKKTLKRAIHSTETI
jgi:hypothetical protein